MNARSLTLTNITKTYDGRHMAADDVSLDIKAGSSSPSSARPDRARPRR